jgi:hypothetical protein
VALLAEHIPQRGGQARGWQVQAALLQEAASLSPILPAWLMPLRSPLTSAMKTGTPICEKLGQFLQRDGLAGAGGAGDQAMAIGQSGQQYTFCGSAGQSKGEAISGFLWASSQ